ncbi:hypothetical protein SAMD00019534_054260 [Acytostelium subglobosum LB1]|uniref:hypothetical protein n=1 Tax=Acytostelium subglobosum LB1 TaxID=1410327 RepID=UPI000644B090|nr:hypothetical protein SAMD00019534_054260 [Acytostelium subglobosum LB1]GAM22251.1 hypothetical protein SAMD00019534_054260 [Acytostelium subglobosum LB1]|eukprot:XP_012754371.1 hypothetical protein SAMD00019534_054260 [Acytostelium subglobosum LB1]
MDQRDHYGVVASMLNDKTDSLLSWKIVPRDNPAAALPSDFALVSLTTTATTSTLGGGGCPLERGEYSSHCDILFRQTLDRIKSHSDIVKAVFPERKIVDPLKGWDDPYPDTEVLVGRKPQGRFHDQIPDMNDHEVILDEHVDGTNRHLFEANQKAFQITEVLDAQVIWDNGFTGKGTKVAIFDTGLHKDHRHFRNVKSIHDYTSEKIFNDEIGHGTFVTGVIASDHEECPGLAPDAELYIFRVFTTKKLSYTSWFLDAFNHAIHIQVDVLNLSIGGHDYMDRPFVEKVWEMSANNIIVVSAIGNDGPLYGLSSTLSNPADQSDVIGVGSIDEYDKIASFSSRGMTTWEIPEGYGRIKPDIVTYGSNVQGSMAPNTFTSNKQCRPLSGTSVSSPVVAGAIALLISTVDKDKRSFVNPASIKQVLLESARPIPEANIFEQGHGKLNLLEAYKSLSKYRPRASFSPTSVDFTSCPYNWPFCTQPLYYSGIPTVVNITIINGMDVSGQIVSPPRWIPASRDGDLLHVSFSYQELIWPWTGHIGLHISVKEEAIDFEGIAEGFVQVNITSPPQLGEQKNRFQSMLLPVKVKVIPTPPRHKRILWDQYHNLRYPSGFLPKDALDIRDEPFDWNGDHPHTNFRNLYQRLRDIGYYLEIIGSPLTCFDPENYGALLIVDPEEEFFPAEIKKIEEDVRSRGLNLIVFADWYNLDIMEKIKFYDDNTERHWTPATGGANIPAINDFLSNFGIYFGDTVFNGDIQIGDNSAFFASGSSIIGFPKGGHVYSAELLDLNRQVLMRRSASQTVPILGLYQSLSMHHEQVASSSHNNSGSSSSGGSSEGYQSGIVAVFGDSTCLDDVRHKIGAHQKNVDDCYWVLESILSATQDGKDVREVFPGITTLDSPLVPHDKNNKYKYDIPSRPKDGDLIVMSKVTGVQNLSEDQCSQRPHQLESDIYDWANLYKYANITWRQRSRVLPNLQMPYIPSKDLDDIDSQYFIPYILVLLALILLMAHFFRRKERPSNNAATARLQPPSSIRIDTGEV